MRTLDIHRDVGAYALGVLDAADAFRFEDHLMECPGCALQLARFSEVREQLDEYVRRTPADVSPFTAVGPDLLRGMLDRTVTARRRSRRRRLALVAAAAVLVVGGPLAVLGTGAGPRETAVTRWSATDHSTGTSAVVTAAGKAWGTDIGLKLERPGVSGVCALIAVGRDGSRETVTTWEATKDGKAPLLTTGGAALRPDQIDHFEVRTADGRRLVTIGG
jgi:hypothetical protein